MTLAEVIDSRDTKLTIDGRKCWVMGRDSGSTTKGAVFMVDTLRVKRFPLSTPVELR